MVTALRVESTSRGCVCITKRVLIWHACARLQVERVYTKVRKTHNQVGGLGNIVMLDWGQSCM